MDSPSTNRAMSANVDNLFALRRPASVAEEPTDSCWRQGYIEAGERKSYCLIYFPKSEATKEWNMKYLSSKRILEYEVPKIQMYAKKATPRSVLYASLTR